MTTKDRILDAAERLFAERGYEGTSLRAITAAAGANLAAVNYHFTSKEALMRALFSRRLGALNRERLQLLDRLEAEAAGAPLPVDKLVRVLLEPPLRLGDKRQASGFGVLLGRMYSAPGGFPQKMLAEELRGFVNRVRGAFRRSLPALPEDEMTWRVFFAIGAMAHTLAAPELLRLISNGACDPGDSGTAAERIVTFVAAGLKAPAASSAGASPGHPPRRTRSTKSSRRQVSHAK